MGSAMSDSFRFAPELFETRTEVMQQLTDAGFDWLSHYSAVDPLHDVYGIEVCGIHDRDDAEAILRLLTRMFPGWQSGGVHHKDYGREPGWKAVVQRDANPPDEQWESA